MIRQFSDALVEAFAREKLPPDLTNEPDFERRFAIPVATQVAGQFLPVELFVRPAPGAQCHPTCDDVSGRALGCPDCWAATKQWACVAAFGTRHTFDMVARDATLTLAVEIKLVEARGGKMPNENIQRFL